MNKLEDQVTEQIQLHVYLIDDGESFWILARSEGQAKQFYRDKINPDYDPEDSFEIKQVDDEIDKKMVYADESFKKKISLREIIEERKAPEIPYILVTSMF